MTDPEQPAHPPDLRGAWRWGVWIGSAVLLIGVLAIAGGLYFSWPGSAETPTPRMIHDNARAGTALFVQGAYAAVIGGAILALSLVNLYCLRKTGEDQSSWGDRTQ